LSRNWVSFNKIWVVLFLCTLVSPLNYPATIALAASDAVAATDAVEAISAEAWQGEPYIDVNDFFSDSRSPNSTNKDPLPIPIADVSAQPFSQQQLTDSSHVRTIKLDAAKAPPRPSDTSKSHSSHCNPATSTSLNSQPEFAKEPRNLEYCFRTSPGFVPSGTIRISTQPMRANVPLKVLSIRPSAHYDSDTPLFNRIIVSFSEPMPPSKERVKSNGDQIPMKVAPRVPGTFKWLDQQTLVFTANNFLPRATTYKITIPKGVRSDSGKVLPENETFTFSTARPEPTLGQTTVDGKNLLSIFFDQKIKLKSLLPRLSASVKDGRRVSLRMASDKEIKPMFGERQWKRGTVVAFYPTGDKPEDEVTFTVMPGIQSVEGSLPSKEKRAIKFATTSSSSFAINKKSAELSKTYEPGQPIFIPFNQNLLTVVTQPLKNSCLKQACISVSPKIENMRIYHHGWALVVTGDTKASTTYKVTVHAGIKSFNKATLEKDETVTIKVGPFKSRLLPPESIHARMNPSVSTLFPIQSINVTKLKVSVFDGEQKTPAENRTFYWDYDAHRKPIFETIVDTGAHENETVTTKVDFKELVDKGHGFFVVVVEDPTASRKDLLRNGSEGFNETRACSRYAAFLEVTSMSLSVVQAQENLLCFLTDAATGQPIQSATVIGLRSLLDPTKLPHKPRPAKSVSAATDKNGICLIALPVSESENELSCITSVVAKKGNDKTEIPVLFQSLRAPAQEYVWSSNMETCQINRNRPVKFTGWVKPVKNWKIEPNVPEYVSIHFSCFDQQKQLLGEGDCACFQRSPRLVAGG